MLEGCVVSAWPGVRRHITRAAASLPSCCWAAPCRNVADSVRDMMYGVHGPRVHGITRMLLEAFHWVQSHHPYW